MLILTYTTYYYYEPTLELENVDGPDLVYYERRFQEQDEYITDDIGDGYNHYFKITNKEQLVKALKYVLDEDRVMIDEYETQTEDLIKLLQDKNLGDTFFTRFVENIKWLQKRYDLKHNILIHHYLYGYHNDLLILDGKTPIYLVKENQELQKIILRYFFDKNIDFKNEWFDMNEQDIQQWRYETDLKNLHDTLTDKTQELKDLQKKIKRLQKEIIDLQKTIAETEGA